ncbi:hypothetical protein KI387_030671, partial [Taxus chinensis]
VKENDVAPSMEKDIHSLTTEERLSMTICFPEPPARGKNTSHRTFEIDLSSVGSTMDHVVHKYSNGIQAANYHQRELLQNTGTQTLSQLHSNEECIDRRVLEQGSDRKMIQSASHSKFSSVYENLSPLESQRLEEDELIPNFGSYLSHVVEKTIEDMTLESQIEVGLPEMNKGMLLPESMSEGCNQQKTSKSHNFPLSPVSQANISPALKLLRKLRNESHIIAYDAYNPSNESIQQATLQSCSPSVTLSQEAIESRRDTKVVEDISQRGFSISNTSRSTTHSEIKCKESSIFKRELRSGKVVSTEILPMDAFRGHESSIFKRELRSGKVVSTEIQPMDAFRGQSSANKKKSKRRKTVNSSTSNRRILEKNEFAICIDSKARIKKLLNCEDWQCLQDAGTSWKNGVRRSSRIRSRPLEFWRGERFLYGRVLN